MRKHQATDLLDLYSKANTEDWNRMLTDCLSKGDLRRLMRELYGIQAGMDDLVKKKLNTEKVNVWYARLVSSIEKTARRIIKNQRANPLDNSLNVHNRDLDKIRAKIEKKRRDEELAAFIRKSSY